MTSPDLIATLRALKRYDLVEYRVYYRGRRMERADEGEWVRYEQVEAEVARLSARVVQLEADLELWKSMVMNLRSPGQREDR